MSGNPSLWNVIIKKDKQLPLHFCGRVGAWLLGHLGLSCKSTSCHEDTRKFTFPLLKPISKHRWPTISQSPQFLKPYCLLFQWSWVQTQFWPLLRYCISFRYSFLCFFPIFLWQHQYIKEVKLYANSNRCWKVICKIQHLLIINRNRKKLK